MKDTKPRRQLNSLDETASILGISISTLRATSQEVRYTSFDSEAESSSTILN
jgi:hypothetical protein